jgi:hypothetical protein
MIIVLSGSALILAALQASITAPTDAFRGCLREAAAKAQTDKVGGDKIEDYLRSACTGQMDALTSAIVAFRMKNGMTKRQASSDAAMTVDDYVSTPADNYKFIINYNEPTAQAAAAPAAPPPKPQPASSQPHK